MFERIYRKILKTLFYFNPEIDKTFEVKKIGTIYGGYDVYVKKLKNPLIISCGLGEDASFDIDMINNFNAKIIALDPTPRAKEYFVKIKKNFGKNREINYNESGNLDIKSYDLRNTNVQNFIFLDIAIWDNSNEKIKLYYPEDDAHVSCSINLKHSKKDNFFLANTISYKKICEKMQLDQIDILKLDIEGSEIKVLNEILLEDRLPHQILVEFDIRRRNTLKNYIELKKIHKKMKKYYDLININLKGDFTYILKE